jgi:hypothetical protein
MLHAFDIGFGGMPLGTDISLKKKGESNGQD